MELLAPCGNYQAFLGAVNAGADAVYLGGSKFGARAYADNFTDEEIIQAIKYAHAFNVKVYLTVNTIIKENEFSDVISYINPFYEAGLDACIVQDLGLISVFHNVFPDMECHISTQGFAIGKESVDFYKQLGASRVVLARELSLKEISEIKKNCDIEIETFIHGAMCYSYSGECLFSSCLGGRSGNRGRCAGPCRQPYSVSDKQGNVKEKYFLSMKDQCTLTILPDLYKAGIDSLKIEGRMKKPEYTAFVTSIYRKYIDLLEKDPNNYSVEEKDLEALKHIYLRSEISEGYYFVKNGPKMISLNSPGYSGNDDKLMNAVKEKYLDKNRKIKISGYIYIHENEEVQVTLNREDYYISVTGPLAGSAQKRPLTVEDIKKQFNKLGDTPFEFENLSVDTDEKSFLPVSVLNDLRRDAINRLFDKIAIKCNSTKTSFSSLEKKQKDFLKYPIISVLNREQLNATRMYEENFYVSCSFELLKDTVLKGNEILSLPIVSRIEDYSKIYSALTFATDNNIKGIIVRNFDELNIILKSNFKGFIISAESIYCCNKEAYSLISSMSDSFIYPLELSKWEIEKIGAKDGYLFCYGKIPLMNTSNCVQKTLFGCNKGSKERILYIKDRTNTDFPVYRDCEFCTNTIYNSVPTFLLDEKTGNIPQFLSFTDENKDEIKKILDILFYHNGNITGYTKAYWKKGVE